MEAGGVVIGKQLNWAASSSLWGTHAASAIYKPLDLSSLYSRLLQCRSGELD